MILNETYTLSNGVRIPRFGLGTWVMTDEQAENAVVNAVKAGYRLIDTAEAYENEKGVGDGVKKCGFRRDEIFVTSKIRAEYKSYASAKKAIDDSLAVSGLDYLDLMIIHCPEPWAEFRGEKKYFGENLEVWRALEDAYRAGKLRAIGVSNFLKDDLDNVLHNCTVKPMVNQILAHISNTPFSLINYCKESGVLTEAYSPMAHGEALKNRLITELAAKYNVSPARLCIRYILNLGMVALPKATSDEHIRDNANVDFEISDEDMLALKNAEPIKDYGEFTYFPVFSGKNYK